MSTTTILVENLIQGLQTFLWIALIGASFVDPQLIVGSQLVSGYPAATAFVAIGVCYWLGIVVDTVYYHVFIQWQELKWARELSDPKAPTLSEMVFACLVASSDVARLLMERQAHLRLFRVSVVNSALTTVALLFYLQVGTARLTGPLFILVAAVGAIVFLTVAYGWRKLYKYYVTMVRTAYGAVMDQKGRDALLVPQQT